LALIINRRAFSIDIAISRFRINPEDPKFAIFSNPIAVPDPSNGKNLQSTINYFYYLIFISTFTFRDVINIIYLMSNEYRKF